MALFPYDWHRAFQDPFEMGQLGGRFAPYWATIPHVRHLDIGNQSGEIENDKEKLTFHVDVSQFRPEELKVHVDGRKLVIEGRHEERSDKLGSIERSFKRSYLLTEDCDLAGVRSSLENDGKLSIVAPKQGAILQKRVIPIKKKFATKGNDHKH